MDDVTFTAYYDVTLGTGEHVRVEVSSFTAAYQDIKRKDVESDFDHRRRIFQYLLEKRIKDWAWKEQ